MTKIRLIKKDENKFIPQKQGMFGFWHPIPRPDVTFDGVPIACNYEFTTEEDADRWIKEHLYKEDGEVVKYYCK